MSPFQAKYGLVPDVSHFRKFGCISYMHIPTETRDKGFVDKAYKCYFLGIDMPTQAYKVWVIRLSEMKVSSNVMFDEYTKQKFFEPAVVSVAAQTRDVKDFLYLIGMVYRDDEDELLYVTSSVVVQKGEIVAYRCAYLQNVVGREEPTPIRVADVERMLNAFLKFSEPLVVFALPVMLVRQKLQPCKLKLSQPLPLQVELLRVAMIRILTLFESLVLSGRLRVPLEVRLVSATLQEEKVCRDPGWVRRK